MLHKNQLASRHYMTWHDIAWYHMIRIIYVIHSYDEQGDKGLRTLPCRKTDQKGTRKFIQVHAGSYLTILVD